jgi:hypothetical protein
MNTNWSTPKKNIIAGINDLRRALAAGQQARLIRARNEDCAYPIKQKNSITDFRAYEFSVGLLKTRKLIASDDRMPEFQKYLALNYKTCYGTEEAVNRYYETGKLSPDNFKGMGRSHLVKVEDMVRWLTIIGNTDLAQMYKQQYFDAQTGDETHFFDHYRLKREHDIYTIKRLKRKLWVVELLKDSEPKARIPWYHKLPPVILRALVYPLKFVPRRSVLRMPEYKVVTYRVGDVINGFSVEFHVPKKFGFN